MDIQSISTAFKKEINGQLIQQVFLENIKGTKVGICNYGARITHFIVSDFQNQPTDIVLGFNNIESYIQANERYHGVTVGPFANRIGNAKFQLDDKTYQLEANDGDHTLHSGSVGFHDLVWLVSAVQENEITLKINHQHLSGGFPGDIDCSITFTLTDEDELKMKYHSRTNEDTVINLTNHAYFNLNGEGSGTILNHQVQINAYKFVEIDESSIPTGKVIEVDQTPFDFRNPKIILHDIEVDDLQLKNGNGYDHSFELDKKDTGLSFSASAIGDKSKIKLEVFTTEPAMQFYSGNFLNGKDKGKSGIYYERRTGFCLETQHHPDSPNQPNFPSTFLAKGEEFNSTTIYKISKA